MKKLLLVAVVAAASVTATAQVSVEEAQRRLEARQAQQQAQLAKTLQPATKPAVDPEVEALRLELKQLRLVQSLYFTGQHRNSTDYAAPLDDPLGMTLEQVRELFKGHQVVDRASKYGNNYEVRVDGWKVWLTVEKNVVVKRAVVFEDYPKGSGSASRR